MLVRSNGSTLQSAGRIWQSGVRKTWNELNLRASASQGQGQGQTKASRKSSRNKAVETISRRLKKALIEGAQVQEATSPNPLNLDWDLSGPDQEEDNDEGEESKQKWLPSEVRCFDTARIQVKSGDGGNGCVAFHREKFIAKGGPSGGSGGRGGHVWAIIDKNLNSLVGFRNKVHFRAGKGGHGKGSNLTGAKGIDAFVSVPPGTVIRVKNEEEVPPLAELLKTGDKALLATGGKGGRGNLAFKTALNNAPTMAENGGPSEELWLELELKVVADVGIIGIPNAGKSTLLAAISAAKPKIANYPFTTLVPNLGVCDYDYQTTVFADVPGMLEGASKGIGLGHEFLRHCMRCRALIHIIDGTSPDPIGDYEAIQLELELFSPDLESKPQIVCYNKTDLPEVEDLWPTVRDLLIEKGIPEERLFWMSAAGRHNTETVVRAVRHILKDLPNEISPETNAMNLQEPLKTVGQAKIENYTVSVRRDLTPRLYIVSGKAIERFTTMTNWAYYEAFRRFQRVLDRSGISDELRAMGIEEGDDVQISEKVFVWSDDNSEQSIYQSFKVAQKESGKSTVGSARWPKGA